LWSEALFRFQQAERLGGSVIPIYNNMAVAYEALGVFEKAREYYQKALEADANNTALRRNYSRFIEFYQSFQPEGEGEGASEEPAAEAASGDAGPGGGAS
jgi:Tfp pilus assembly protein PilF